jgi:hypothetical protein
VVPYRPGVRFALAPIPLCERLCAEPRLCYIRSMSHTDQLELDERDTDPDEFSAEDELDPHAWLDEEETAVRESLVLPGVPFS